jgi:hypothetical protein
VAIGPVHHRGDGEAAGERGGDWGHWGSGIGKAGRWGSLTGMGGWGLGESYTD